MKKKEREYGLGFVQKEKNEREKRETESRSREQQRVTPEQRTAESVAGERESSMRAGAENWERECRRRERGGKVSLGKKIYNKKAVKKFGVFFLRLEK